MSKESLFTLGDVTAYLDKYNPSEHPVLKALRQKTSQLPEANMQISPLQGQFMALLAKLIQVERYLEIGTFTGYSSLVLALSMPDSSEVHCCDCSEIWTNIAKQYWQKAGVDKKITLHLGDADYSLQQLLKQKYVFDMVFIDADKTNYQTYFDLSLRLVRAGGLIVIDNTLWSGRVANNYYTDKDTAALRDFNRYLKQSSQIDFCLLPLVDGLTLVRKNT